MYLISKYHQRHLLGYVMLINSIEKFQSTFTSYNLSVVQYLSEYLQERLKEIQKIYFERNQDITFSEENKDELEI